MCLQCLWTKSLNCGIRFWSDSRDCGRMTGKPEGTELFLTC
jgi:hypothetical protein